MHPQIKQPDSGQCPICAMDLIPMHEDVGHKDAGQKEIGATIRLSETARTLAEIETTPAIRGFTDLEIRLSGTVRYDETRLSTITARVAGRVERLYADYTGIAVRDGDHLAELYSPELITAQEELIQALKGTEVLDETEQIGSRKNRATLEASRRKLALLGLTERQIHDIERRKEPLQEIIIYSPQSGIVIEQHVQEGMYVREGTPIYTVADLQTVWMMLDVFESDIQWIRYGQRVTAEVEAYPGKILEGRIAFIDPIVDERSRAIRIRINVQNPDLILKPGMLIRAEVHAIAAQDGIVAGPDLEGKWISPMHPEVIKNGPGICDMCGMTLVPWEEVGYIESAEAVPPLIIPASAPLITGRRAIVYVSDPSDPGIFHGRQIDLGPRAGEYYIVKSGLTEGEHVVTRGNFKIDSALQIAGKSSMMNSRHMSSQTMNHKEIMSEAAAVIFSGKEDQEITNGLIPDGGDHPAKSIEMDHAVRAYNGLQAALTEGDLPVATNAIQTLLWALSDINKSEITSPGLRDSVSSALRIVSNLESISDIEALRAGFKRLSEAFKSILEAPQVHFEGVVFVFNCPMAFEGLGANWLSDQSDVRNPYFGSTMLTCGSLIDTLQSHPDRPPKSSRQ
jgi:Cu(I)/Ag(I) efflux system membrane fusion protein